MKISEIDEAQKLVEYLTNLKAIIADEQRYHSILKLELKCSTGETIKDIMIKTLRTERTTIINTLFEGIRVEYRKVLKRLKELGVEL